MQGGNNINRKLETLLNLIYPPSLYCGCCGNLIDETRTYNLCDHCVRHIKWDTGEVKEKYGLKMLRCAEYGIYERTLIFSLKYNGKKYIARDIAEIMRDRLMQAQVDYDIIVPVPMNKNKELKRGFNQTNLIGKYLAVLMDKTFAPGELIRVRDTLPMRGLSPSEREMNVKDSFALAGDSDKILKNKRILLIDDFFTTGATAAECARTLSGAEPEDVLLIAFAAKY